MVEKKASKSGSSRTTVRLPDDLHRRAKLAAAWSGRKIQDLIAEAVERHLSTLEDAMDNSKQADRRR